MSKLKKQFIYIFLIVAVMLSFCGSSAPQVALASTSNIIDFDYSYVLDDLTSSTTYGAEFNVTDYPADADGKLQLMTFQEYAYTAESARRGHYGLYLYLYNPAGIEFPVAAPGNKIQIAVSYNENGSPIDYEKFDLKILSTSVAPFANRFIKLKVVDRSSGQDSKKIADRVNPDARRYDVSGFELISKDALNATEYPVQRTFIFSGFATGYGSSATESTLKCDVQELETIELQVHSTYYRTGLSALGNNHENQLESVYFGVDNRYLEEYGRLQRIKAEWYEYKTKSIVVTSHQDAYNAILPNLGRTAPSDLGYSLYQDYYISKGDYVNYHHFSWAYNGIKDETYIGQNDDILYYLFSANDIQAYDPRGSEAVIGGVKSNDLYQHITTYDKSYKNGALSVKNGTISADLFTDSVDEARVPLFDALEAGRTNGYYVHDFDADVDLHQMPSYNTTNPGFIQKVGDFGLWNTIFGKLPELDDSYNDVSPIYQVTDADITSNHVEMSKNLLIREDDIPAFKTYYASEKQAGRKVFLFRFATTDYFSAPIAINPSPNPQETHDEAYRAQETVFLDFDIIQLTFNKQGVYTIIPVVSNPIDIVADITPPAHIPEPSLDQFFGGIADGLKDLFNWPDLPDWPDWSKLAKIIFAIIVAVVALVVLILLIPVLIPLIKLIFKGLWWFFITLPSKAIKSALKRSKERRQKKKAKKQIETKAGKSPKQKQTKVAKPKTSKQIQTKAPKRPKPKKYKNPKKPKTPKAKIKYRGGKL